MARSIPVIYTQLLQQKNNQSALTNLNSPSQVSIWNLWLWITAAGQNLFEQLCDLFTANIETQIANAPVFTPQWIVQMCKLYQYSASAPQIVQLNTSATYPYVTIGYPVVNSSLCPVTQAAVVSNTNHELVIKVTGSGGPLDGTPTVTTGPICSGLISYLNQILTPDTQYQIINDDADQLFIQAEIYYNASYSGVIQNNVESAITNYLLNIPFNGTVTISALEEAILGVAGVSDVVLSDVYWRQATDPVPSGGTAPASPPTNEPNQLVNNYMLIKRNYQTYAGYIIPETTTGYTLSDYITYTAS
jgi:hypothetical protein